MPGHRLTATLLAVLMLLTIPMAGCLSTAPSDGGAKEHDGSTDDTSSGSSDGTSTLTTYVKDAPTDEFSEVWVTFDRVRVHYAGNLSAVNTSNLNVSSEGWITVVDDTRSVDLLAYNASDARAFLGEEDVPDGKYNQIRIRVTDAWGVSASTGENVTITPNTDEVKVLHTFNVDANHSVTRVVIDLDLDKSLKSTGSASSPQGVSWKLIPVIGTVHVEHTDQDDRADHRGGDGEGDGANDDGAANGNGTQAGDGSGNGSGNATAYVKDAPTDEFDEIWLTFTQVEVHRAGGNGTGYDANASDDGAWVTLVDTTRSVNLLNFSDDGARAFLGDAELETGRYTQVRLHVTDAWGMQNGSRVNITTANTTAKVVQSFEVTANATTQIVIDVDLDRSLVKQGNAASPEGETWRLTPVIGSVVTDHVDHDARQDVPDQATA